MTNTHEGARHSDRPSLLRPVVWAALLALALAIPLRASAQDANALSVQATDPTSSLMAFNLYADARMSYHGDDRTGLEFRVQPVIPFNAFGFSNLLRITVPYQLGGPGAEGLKSVTFFDLLVMEEEWGRFGFGPVMTLSEGITDREAQFGIGPAVGAVVAHSPELSFGIFNQNLIGDDLALSQFQPIAAYQLGNGWALSLGDLQFVYDWDNGDWVNVPIGFELGLVQPIAGQPMRFSVGPQWNLRDKAGTPESKINFRVVLLAPTN